MVRNGVSDPPEPGLGGARADLIVLSLSAFAAVTTEMAPVGLLPAIGHAFGVGESTAGLLVSLYAVIVAVLAVPLTLATKRVPGKRLLLLAMSSYTISNVIAALAPSLAVLAVGRAMGGVTHALFFSVFIGYATRLVPPAQTGRALALASVGVPVGFVLGVPLATTLGNAVGWRAAFVALAALTAVVGVLIAVMLPDVRPQADERRPGPGRLRQMVAVIGSNTLVFVGQYTLYTYVSVLLLRSGASSRAVGPILLVFGVFGLIGVWSAGPRLDRHLRGTALVVLALLAAGIAAAGAAFPVLALVIVAGAVWNGAFGAVPSVYQTAAVRTQSTSPELAGAWINASSNAGIAVGAALGGLVLGSAGIREATWLAAAFVILAIVMVLLTLRRRSHGVPVERLPAGRLPIRRRSRQGTRSRGLAVLRVKPGLGPPVSTTDSVKGWPQQPRAGRTWSKETVMSVYRVTEIIGTSSTSWEDAAAEAIRTAAGTLRDLRVGEVIKQDIHLDEAGAITYRTKLQLSFKYEADH